MKQGKKVILVTGASRGIGRFLVEYYAALKYQVLGCSRSASSFSTANYQHFRVDVTDEKQVRKMIQDIDNKHGRLDVLINNAGQASMNHALLTPLETVKRLINVNFVAVFLLAREAAKIMMKSKCGRIVNLSTVAVPLQLEGEAVYASSKSAIETLTKILAKELAGFNITCNVVGPAPIKTDLIKNVPENKIKNIIDSLAIKRLGKHEDVANVIDFYISEKSDYISGQIVYLGGV